MVQASPISSRMFVKRVASAAGGLAAFLCAVVLSGAIAAGPAAAQAMDPKPGVDTGPRMDMKPGKGTPGQSLIPAGPRQDKPASKGVPKPADPAMARTDRVTARLLTEHKTVRPGGTVWVALHLSIKKGWHTYWRNPGDSGEPTQIQWTLPAGVKAGGIVWMAPRHHRVSHLVNYGYEDEAIHLVPITVPQDARAGQTLPLKAHAMWLVCEKICVPEEAKLQVRVQVDAAPPARAADNRAVFQRARQAVPQKSPWAATAATAGKDLVLRIKGARLKRDKVAGIHFYPIQPGIIRHAAAQSVGWGGDDLTLRIPKGPRLRPGKPVTGVLVITEKLDSGTVRQAFRIAAKPTGPAGGGAAAGGGPGGPAGGAAGAEGASAAAGDAGNLTFWMAILFALVGGLILNLMPCVLPVLSMKALAMAQHARSEASHLRAHGWVYTLGVLATFGLITVLLLLLRAGGEQIGWGYQLQSPLIVLLLAWLMFAIGLYFVGLIEFGGRIAGVGSGLAARGGYSGSFFTGALAVVAAAPCTVPFMGAAMGFAFLQPWPTTVAIMLALGFGMALPFLLLSHAPALLRFIPRPGPWMTRFKQFLAFPMFGTAVWLTWVATLQAGDMALLAALGGAVLIAFAVWTLRASADAGVGWRTAAMAAALLAVFVTGAGTQYALQNQAGSQDTAARAIEAGDVPLFTPARLEAARQAGQAVFVNYTAAWCVTCIVNEQRILTGAWFRKAMADANIVYMKGDWTRRDPAITRELRRFNRLGVPLYVFYPAAGSAMKPEVLPQILTESRVRAAIARFARDSRERAQKR